jgi:hypothetical protein
MTREHLFLSELAVIERVIAWVCARRCLRGADAEDFASVVKSRLIENDYEVLAKFQGRSSLNLPDSVSSLSRLPGAALRRWRHPRGLPAQPVAVPRCLMFRDGLTFDEAAACSRATRARPRRATRSTR